MEKELEKLVQATNITDRVFQQRGYESHSVDIGKYLLTGNPMSFTNASNARDMVSDIDLDKLNEEVKSSLIEETIVTLVDRKRERLLSNNIPTIIVNWTDQKLSNHKDKTTFDELYLQLLRTDSTSRYIVNSIQTASLYYKSAENEINSRTTSNINYNRIAYLLKEREAILLRLRNKQR